MTYLTLLRGLFLIYLPLTVLLGFVWFIWDANSWFCYNELWNAPEQGILNAVACVLIDSKATSEAFYKIPQFINNIKKKHQARRYTAFLKKVNEPVRKTGLR